METKGERRGRMKRNRGKMSVRGRSIFTILAIKIKKAREK